MPRKPWMTPLTQLLMRTRASKAFRDSCGASVCSAGSPLAATACSKAAVSGSGTPCRSLITLPEPLADRGRENRLRLSADEHADVPARHRFLGVVVRANQVRQRSGGCRCHHMIVLGVDVEQWRTHVAQVDALPAELEFAPHELVVLVQV